MLTLDDKELKNEWGRCNASTEQTQLNKGLWPKTLINLRLNTNTDYIKNKVALNYQRPF